MNGDHRDHTDHVVPVTPVIHNTSVISDKEVSVESESGDTLVDSEDEDLSPEKDRVLQMLDSVIQEQEESFVGEIFFQMKMTVRLLCFYPGLAVLSAGLHN